MLENNGNLRYCGPHAQLEEMAKQAVAQVYSDDKKKEWAKLIHDFNELYYDMGAQTWSITNWRGVRVLKPPTDMWVYQELITEIKPGLIIETGTWCGGSALFMRDVLDKVNPSGEVVTIDIEPERIDARARVPGITFIPESSVDQDTIGILCNRKVLCNEEPVMVILDSNHSYEHVSRELELYAPFVTVGSILIVEDGSNCDSVQSAIKDFFPKHPEFKANYMGEKFMLTFNRDGYWEKVAP